MLAKRLIKSNDAGGGGACTNTVDLYNPFPDGGGVALYQLNGNATDVSGNYNGTASNVTYGAGQFGQAGVFNGSSSIIDLPNNSFNFTTVSVSFWLKLNSITGEDYVLDVYDEASAARGYAISTDASNKIKFRAWNNNFSEVFSSSTLSLNTWYYIAMVATQTSASIYINGSLDNSGSLNGFSFQAQQSTSIGAYRGRVGIGSIAFLDGSLDQVRIFNRALRPYEVEALYTEEYCTPTIVPSEHFNTVLYTGTGASQSITNVGFQPDFTWIKNRSRVGVSHSLQDSVRGTGASKTLYTDGTYYEGQYGNFGYISSFDIDGFTVNPSSSALHTSQSGDTYVAWNFKAGGSAVTNTDGTITSQVSANTDAGFSVVSYTGNSTAGATIGHGLNNSPSVIITKGLNATSAYNWMVYHSALTQGTYGYLNLTNAFEGPNQEIWYNAPTSNLFSIGSNVNLNANGPYIAYCFAEVEGFSNFGSFVGTGTTSGQLVVTGFEPAFVMWKKTSNSTSAHWNIVDNKRSLLKNKNNVLYPNLSSAEDVTSYDLIDFNENGFQVKAPYSQFNESGATFIYMAFAADPTTIEPSLEDSFNTVTYDGNNSTNPITDVGFQPDFVWIKNRTNANSHILVDSVRGNNSFLESDGTGAESIRANEEFASFDPNGFTLQTNYIATNNSSYDYVAWCWKGAELPAINSNGSIKSVVSANPAAGFSIVSYTGNGSAGATIGHGLGVKPNMIIVKNRNILSNFVCYNSNLGATKYLLLNTTDAQGDLTEIWNDTEPTDSVYSVGFSTNLNGNGNNHIAYCFAEVVGFSKFGSYTGNGTTGNKQTINFEPAFVLIKRTNDAGAWSLYDNKRSPTNPRDKKLVPNSSAAENVAGTTYQLNFYSDGFDFNGGGADLNVSGGTYIYMAFANQF